MGNRLLSRLKAVDFYKKIPSDLTEATLTGASISIAAALSIVLLLAMELNGFITPEFRDELVVDRSPPGELLRVNFNVSFPSLSCEFAALDVSDSLGTKRLNLTKTVRKLPITEDMRRAGYYMHDDGAANRDIKYDDDDGAAAAAGGADPFAAIDYSAPVDAAHFAATLARYPVVVVNFYAPWCPWCQRLEPTWEAVTGEVHAKYPEEDRRVRFAKVDCTVEADLCREHAVTGYPSIRVFRAGHDDVNVHGFKDHESYRGDRTKEALLAFADTLAASAGEPHQYVAGVTRMAATAGCSLSGFALVKKVPGTLHFVARAPGHSFDVASMNLSHVVHHYYFGAKPSPRRRKSLETMHPLGLTDDWADKLGGSAYFSQAPHTTFEHYAQVVLTSLEPAGRRRAADAGYDAYEYVVHSHSYVAEGAAAPAAKFSHDMSPIQIVVTERRKAFYHFVTSTCAVVGGVFTVAGILDSVVHGARVALKKKVDLGKAS